MSCSGSRRGSIRGAVVLCTLLFALGMPAWNARAQSVAGADGAAQASGVREAGAGNADPAVAAPQAQRQPAAVIHEVEAEDSSRSQRRSQRSTAKPLGARISLYAGEAASRRVPGTLRRVAVGDGEVVNVINVSKHELVFIATKAGETNVHLWMADGSQHDVEVVVNGGKAEGLAETIRELLVDAPGVVVRAVGPNVFVSGNEVDAASAARIAALQKVYPQIVNLASTDPVGMRPMVLMDVTIMEFSKDAVEDLGIRWDSTINGPVGGLIRDAQTNDYFRVLPKDEDTFAQIRDSLPNRLPGPQGYFGIATTIASQINLLMSRGKAWVLAEPKLSAKSGSSATFLVGGEVPIVVPSVLGQTQIEYKEYGIRLNINPTVNRANDVATSIMAEVSRIDPSVSVQGVPGFLTRRVETELNVAAGETIVISGLLDRKASKAADKLPILGDIPVLGRLFRSDAFRGNRTELVIFVTPRIVTPGSPENLEQLRKGEQINESLESSVSNRQRKLVN